MFSRAIHASRHISSRQSTLLHQNFVRTRLLTDVSGDGEIQPPPVRTAYIKTWEPLKNIGEVYTLLRALERKYGKVLDARFAKDFEDPTKNQMIAWVVFEDPRSLQRIPLEGIEVAIPSPSLTKEQHEIGLEDVENLSRSLNYEEGYEFPSVTPDSEERVLGCRITRSEFDYAAASKDSLFQPTPKSVASAFLRWGGFHNLTPLNLDRDIVESELFGRTPLDSVRMRASLQVSAQITGMQNPALVSKGKMQPSSSTQKPIITSLLFGEATPQSLSQAPSTSSSPPKLTDAVTTKISKPQTAETLPSSSLPKERDAATIAQELANQEALKRQLDFAKQLKQQSAPRTRRRQPKPPIKVAKAKGPQFFADEFLPQDEGTKSQGGIIDKLWNLFGRK